MKICSSLFVLLALALSIQGLKLDSSVLSCPSYICSDKISNESYTVSDTDSVTIYECPQNYSNSFSILALNSSNCVLDPQPSNETSKETSDYCLDTISQHENCTFEDFCEEGYYCNNETLKCSNRNTEDEPCTYLYECEKGTVCNQGKCIEFFSLGVGKKADSNIACKSGIVKNFVCQAEQVTNNTDNEGLDEEDDDFIKECESDEDCIAKDGVTPGKCVCGASLYGKSYCLPHRSDSISKKLLTAAYNEEQEKLKYRVFKINNFVLLKSAKANGEIDESQDCLKDSVEYNSYESLKKASEKCGSIFLAAAFFLAYFN